MKQVTRYAFTAVATAATALISAQSAAQISDDVVKIGVIVDKTGVYSGIGGPGGVKAVEMAVKDFGGTINGKKIEIVSADYQNKVDIALSKARE